MIFQQIQDFCEVLGFPLLNDIYDAFGFPSVHGSPWFSMMYLVLQMFIWCTWFSIGTWFSMVFYGIFGSPNDVFSFPSVYGFLWFSMIYLVLQIFIWCIWFSIGTWVSMVFYDIFGSPNITMMYLVFQNFMIPVVYLVLHRYRVLHGFLWCNWFSKYIYMMYLVFHRYLVFYGFLWYIWFSKYLYDVFGAIILVIPRD